MITLNVNGKPMSVDADPDTPLLWVLRDHLGMTGTKYGCGMALCGACTVHMNGQPARSCSTSLAAVAGKRITTIEGIGQTKEGRVLQEAWIANDVPQCGYCQSGQIMSAAALLAKVKRPTDAEIESAMTSGSPCRRSRKWTAPAKAAAGSSRPALSNPTPSFASARTIRSR
ncbi:MAG: (2Fe-2S)-binding protein [Betaproteobacteria bacterium]|nr:MAG: (2Fe-2S)-binding protein [Betaproteobacteria bacterium]